MDQKSVTELIEDLKQGNEDAASQLWEHYFEKMMQAARMKLGRRALTMTDEEDIAISAFDGFCREVAQGHFDRLNGWDELWALLRMITTREVVDFIRWENRQRRGNRNVVRESELFEKGQDKAIDDILVQGPTPEHRVLLNEEFSRLLSELPDETFRKIVKWKIEGLTHERIADLLGISVHAVGRKLRLIRQVWSHGRNT